MQFKVTFFLSEKLWMKVSTYLMKLNELKTIYVCIIEAIILFFIIDVTSGEWVVMMFIIFIHYKD
jgi:hypothetical protein